MNDEAPAEGTFTSSNIAEFERSSAMILAKLYEAFPVPVDLVPNELESQPSTEIPHIHSSTIEFLEAEGYLRHGEVNRHSYRGRTYGMVYYDAVLSANAIGCS
jgi:hypothetical protein